MYQKKIIRLILGAVTVFFIFGPLSSLVIWSFAEKWYWPALFPQKWGLLYWKKVADTTVLKSLTVSVWIALVTMLASIGLTVVPAYILARKKIPARAFIMMVFLLPQAFPQLPVFVNLLTEFYRLNLVGTFTGVILVHVTIGMLFSLWILVSVFQSIPVSYELAAYNLGAGRLRTWMQITLPQAFPGIIVAAILAFLNSLDEFTGSLLIGAPYIKTMSVFMYNTAMGYEMQIASVVSILLTIPGILLLIVLERFMKAEYLAGFGRV